jgi:hypothetical protein
MSTNKKSITVVFYLRKVFSATVFIYFFIEESKKYNILTINLTCILIINNGSQNLFRRLN